MINADLLLLVAAFLPCCAVADLPLLKNDTAFESTYFQFAPAQTYESSDAISPRVDVLRNASSNYKTYAEEEDRPVYSLITPSNWMLPQEGGIIFDSDGTLIWHGKDFEFGRNLQVQTYKGKEYLTFFQQQEFSAGHASGVFYMLDSNYKVFKKFDAGHGFRGDLHEFKITKEDTALITMYKPIKVDLSDVTKIPFQSWVWESYFQEFDLETNKVLFEWKASDHYKFSDDYRKGPELRGWWFAPWDWFHINSIDKHPDGNYLISSRHLTHLALVSGKTGNVLWKLGGRRLNEFTDLSDGLATNFQYQHHATWASEDEILLFDNNINYEGTSGPYSRGMRIKIDAKAKTVKLITEFIHPLMFSAETQGSVQLLPNNNILVGWGKIPAYTEFSPAGEVVVDTHFAPSAMWDLGGIASYRVFQYPWVGRPSARPDVALRTSFNRGEEIYVSWNGATEVASWSLYHGDSQKKKELKKLATFAKDGFETVHSVNDKKTKRFIQLSALDASGDILHSSRILDRTSDKAYLKPQFIRTYHPWRWGIFKVILLLIGVIVLLRYRRYVFSGLLYGLRSVRGRRGRGHYKSLA